MGHTISKSDLFHEYLSGMNDDVTMHRHVQAICRKRSIDQLNIPRATVNLDQSLYPGNTFVAHGTSLIVDQLLVFLTGPLQCSALPLDLHGACPTAMDAQRGISMAFPFFDHMKAPLLVGCCMGLSYTKFIVWIYYLDSSA